MENKLDFEKIIQAALYNDPELTTTPLYEHATTTVVQVHTPTPVIVRIAAGDTASYTFQAKLLNELSGQNALTSQILHWETREIESQPYGIQIQTYIPGQPIERYPDQKDTKAIMLAAHQLHTRLCAASDKVETQGIPKLHDLIAQMLPMVADCPVKTAAEKLVNHPRYIELISQPEQCLIYGDMWYKNILLEHIREHTTARFIDIDPIVIGPAPLQPAILFASYFLFSTLVLPPQKTDAFDLEYLLSCWPEPLNREDILLLMQVFPVGLGLMKTFQLSQSNTGPDERQKILAPFEKSIQVIDEIIGVS